jgi:YkoY family integral membrane protein
MGPLASVEIWGQVFATSDVMLVILLVVLEGVLSIDNALVLGLLAKRLPPHQRARALSYGLIGAFVFRFAAIALATFLLKSTIAKFLGGAYLVFIAVKHLVFSAEEKEPDTVVMDESGMPQLVDQATGKPLSLEREDLELRERMPFDIEPSAADTTKSQPAAANWKSFWWTVFIIELTDIAFAVDSIVAAIGVVGPPPAGLEEGALHPKLWIVVLGGFLGVIVMRFAAVLFIRLLEKFPRFETAAYLLVVLIGLKLLADWGFNSDWTSWGMSWNHDWAMAYASWLSESWIFHVPAGTEPVHLLNFHDLRRPECIFFWVSMIAAFCFGFLSPATATNPDQGHPEKQPR